ncbi:MAG: MBL fold metallo-hydrolase [Candidatus Lindowbacteria bacterium]|nr:MBL fold metallo-hydrolase [Candidatus Lindowbacteria bacterium]
MKARFYDVRGSLPTPGPNTVRYGGNTPCVEVQIPESDQIFIIDAGTGIRELGNKLASQRDTVINLLISHTHWDHIHGFPFFVPIYLPHHTINVLGPTSDSLDLSLQDVLTKQMEYTVFPVRFGDLQATISYSAMKKETLKFGDVSVTAHPLNHPVLTLGYRIEHQGKTLVYQSDHEPFYNLFSEEDESAGGFIEELNQEIVDFAKDADLLIADAMYTPKEYETHRGWGHSNTHHVLDRAIAANVKNVVLYHHDPNHTDEFMDGVLEDLKSEAEKKGATDLGIFVAEEGKEFDL